MRPTKSGGWKWIGYYFDAMNLFLGIYDDEPDVLYFETKKFRIAKDAQKKVGIEVVEKDDTSPGGMNWSTHFP